MKAFENKWKLVISAGFEEIFDEHAARDYR